MAFGLDIVDICGETMDCIAVVRGDNVVLSTSKGGETPNELQEQTVTTLAGACIASQSNLWLFHNCMILQSAVLRGVSFHKIL